MRLLALFCALALAYAWFDGVAVVMPRCSNSIRCLTPYGALGVCVLVLAVYLVPIVLTRYRRARWVGTLRGWWPR
jgi:hypothetical protein